MSSFVLNGGIRGYIITAGQISGVDEKEGSQEN